MKTLRDADGAPLATGDSVTLLTAPDELLAGLPAADRAAIEAQVGKRLAIEGFDDYGHVELTFRDPDGNMHFIWVDPACVRKGR